MRVAVIFINIGSYHAARLKAAQRACTALGWELDAVQVTGDTLEHAWGQAESHVDGSLKFTTLIEHTADSPSDVRRPFSYEAGTKTVEYLNRTDPDAVLTPGWSFSTAVASLRWCRKRGKIAIVASESNEFDAPRRWWREIFKAYRVRRFSSALVGGRSHARYLKKLGFAEDKIAFGYDVVDNDSFHPSRLRSLPRPHAKPFFLAVSRFIPKKNLPFVVEAYSRYRRQSPDPWDLILCGDGVLRPELERLIASLNLSASVRLTGFLKPNELMPFFAHAGCLVHASTEEQWGLVVNEASASGLPILVSNRCGCAEDLVEDGVNGFVFDPFRLDQLSNLMAGLARDAEGCERMGRKSLEKISEFPASRFGEGLIQAVKTGSKSLIKNPLTLKEL